MVSSPCVQVAGATSETASKKMPNGMLGGVPLADVEAALSAALNASLCVPARERPAFIARRLVGDATDALPALPAERPAELEDELAELSELVRDAVNCAARHADQPLQRIADHLLRQGREKLGLQLAGDDEELALGRAEAEAAAAAAAAATWLETTALMRKGQQQQ